MIPFRVAETLEKFLESGSKCYTCSALCTVNEKIFIFGKNAANFAEIIQFASNISINCSDNSDLFICKKSNRKSRRPSKPERNRELNGCCDLKMESPTKHCFSSVLETLERKV